MNDEQRKYVKMQINEAYRSNQVQWAYYLELCLKTNEAPR